MYRTTAIIIGLGMGIWALPASAKPSTFQKSCSGAKLVGSPQQVVLKAACTRKNNSLNTSASIEITGIANMPAGLTYTGEPHSTFQNSCTNIKLVAIGDIVRVTAQCQDGRGGTRTGTINIDNIENVDGVLKYMPR